MLMRVSSISSPTVMVLEFAWKPRCVTIMSENWSAISTLDISRADGVIVQPRSAAVLTFAAPELFEISKKFPPARVSPAGWLN